MDISFIIITCNSAAYIEACLDSYVRQAGREGISAEFFLVDNGSTDATVSIIEDVRRRHSAACAITLERLNKNYGTTVSRNRALRKASGDFIIICDSDTEFLSGSIAAALRYLSARPRIGIIAPLLLYDDGGVQPSVKKFPTFSGKIKKLKNIFLGLPVTDDFYARFPWPGPRPVDTAISACWLFRKEMLAAVGELDEHIFYSPEDIDYCIRVWAAGRQVMFYPDLRVKHKSQQLTHRRPFSRIALSHFWGLVYTFRKHGYFFSRHALYRKLGLRRNQWGEIDNSAGDAE